MKPQLGTHARRLLGIGPVCGAALAAVAIGFAASEATSAQGGQEDLDSTRQAITEWVQTRQLISQEKRDFEIGREVLEARIDLLQREIESLRKRTADADSSIAEADKERDELFEESEALKAASAKYAETVVLLEGRTKELLIGMPEPILDRVKSLSQRIPEDPESTKLGLSERFISIIGILNEVDRFNREITLTSEVQQLPNGTTAEVAVMYVGVGHAYYVTNNGDAAGVGTSTPEGWTWKEANASAADIALAIDILKNKEIAQYVRLPIQID